MSLSALAHMDHQLQFPPRKPVSSPPALVAAPDPPAPAQVAIQQCDLAIVERDPFLTSSSIWIYGDCPDHMFAD